MTRDDMPDKDITLGEVYRAVLSLRDEFAETRKEIHESQKGLRDDVTSHALDIKELQVRYTVLSGALEAMKQAPPSSSDPLARALTAGAAVGYGILTWWLNKGGG